MLAHVTVGSIRWRILKVGPHGGRKRRRAQVTVGSIRWRILKDAERKGLLVLLHGYSGLDPMEDTERCPRLGCLSLPRLVTVGSIRWRILKGTLVGIRARTLRGYSGLDPMEDTESLHDAPVGLDMNGLQWARSDGGY